MSSSWSLSWTTATRAKSPKGGGLVSSKAWTTSLRSSSPPGSPIPQKSSRRAWGTNTRRPCEERYAPSYSERRINEHRPMVAVHHNLLLCIWWHMVQRRREPYYPLLSGCNFAGPDPAYRHRPGQDCARGDQDHDRCSQRQGCFPQVIWHDCICLNYHNPIYSHLALFSFWLFLSISVANNIPNREKGR